MGCDTDLRRAITGVIYWLAVCCYVVGTEKRGLINQPGSQAARWPGRQLGVALLALAESVACSHALASQ